jgi:hypothetical protein
VQVPPQPGDPGDTVRVVMSKYGGRPHWELDGTYLGSDEHGDWIGAPAGTLNARPGARFVSEVDAVTLVPREPAGSPEALAAHLATFHAPGIWCRVYVDITTPGTWDGHRLCAVDLDLDVVRGSTGRVWVDDEDEFAEHRVSLGYPDDLADAALASCARVHAAVRECRPPYDGAADRWLARVAGRRRS